MDTTHAATRIIAMRSLCTWTGMVIVGGSQSWYLPWCQGGAVLLFMTSAHASNLDSTKIVNNSCLSLCYGSTTSLEHSLRLLVTG